MKQWNTIFKKEGKVFFEPQEDMPRMVKLFKGRGIKKVLDLGCGSGRHTVYLAKNGFDVYGIDIAPIGIKLTKDWLKQEKLKANLKLGSIFKKLPYKSNFFGAIVAIQVINHGRIENIRKLIKEIERILKPNGLIFITFTQRSKIKNWRVNSVQKVKFIGDDGISTFEQNNRILGPRTYVPISGTERGLIHYAFDKNAIKKEFKDFKIHRISLDSKKCRYALLAELIDKNSFTKMGFHESVVPQVLNGKISTWRLRDHKLKEGDVVAFENSRTEEIFGFGEITKIIKTTVGQIDLKDRTHYKTYKNRQELIEAFKRHNPSYQIDNDTPVFAYTYKFRKNK